MANHHPALSVCDTHNISCTHTQPIQIGCNKLICGNILCAAALNHGNTVCCCLNVWQSCSILVTDDDQNEKPIWWFKAKKSKSVKFVSISSESISVRVLTQFPSIDLCSILDFNANARREHFSLFSLYYWHKIYD